MKHVNIRMDSVGCPDMAELNMMGVTSVGLVIDTTTEGIEKMYARPVGHITELIQELRRWTANRERCNARNGNTKLKSDPLRMTCKYLEEYRDILNIVRST